MTRTLALAAVAVSSITAAQAETLVFAHGYAPAHVVTTHGIEPFMACVAQATQDEITFDHMPSGEVATFSTSMDAVNNGLAQISAILPAEESNKLPLNGIPILPGMGDSSVEMVEAFRGALDGGGALADEIAQNRLHPLMVNVLPPYQIMSTIGPIDTLEKFDGLLVRVGGGAMNFTASALGAKPVQIGAEMYVALERGTINATFLAVTSVKTYSVDELVNAISGNGSFGSGATIVAMDEGAWEAASPEHQKALTDCGLKAEMDLAHELDSRVDALKDSFAAQGIDVYDFSPEAAAAISERLDTVAEDYIRRLEDRGLPAQEAYESYRADLAE